VQPFKKFPAILLNLKVHYCIHKSSPLVSQTNLSTPRFILILSSLGLLSGLFPSGFLMNNLHAFLFSPIRATEQMLLVAAGRTTM
jgi:hypothetical protein